MGWNKYTIKTLNKLLAFKTIFLECLELQDLTNLICVNYLVSNLNLSKVIKQYQ